MRLSTIVVLVLTFAAGARASETEEPHVTVDAVVVEPASPGASSLCGLAVRLQNHGDRRVSHLVLEVTIDGTPVSTYEKHTFAVVVEAGTSRELKLHNFWTPPTAKRFDVLVTLTEARWVDVTREGTTTTVTPSGPVGGLPASGKVTVAMAEGS